MFTHKFILYKQLHNSFTNNAVVLRTVIGSVTWDSSLPASQYWVSDGITHACFTKETMPDGSTNMENDIALLRVSRDIDFVTGPQYSANSICLPDPMAIMNMSGKAITAGWGYIRYEEFDNGSIGVTPLLLQKATVEVLDYRTCQKIAEANQIRAEHLMCTEYITKGFSCQVRKTNVKLVEIN